MKRCCLNQIDQASQPKFHTCCCATTESFSQYLRDGGTRLSADQKHAGKKEKAFYALSSAGDSHDA